MGIEPTKDDTRLSGDFEDHGAHQLLFQPQATTLLIIQIITRSDNSFQLGPVTEASFSLLPFLAN